MLRFYHLHYCERAEHANFILKSTFYFISNRSCLQMTDLVGYLCQRYDPVGFAWQPHLQQWVRI